MSDASLTDGQKSMAIDAICESRYRPTTEDLARTPALARQWTHDEPD